VPFTYCSPEYFETNTLNITVCIPISPSISDTDPLQVFLASATDPTPTKNGIVLGTQVGTNDPDGYGYGYTLNLAIPKSAKPAPKSQLFVLEWYSGYAPAPAVPTTTYAVNVEF
jgi:hypothetical protein